MTKYIFVPKNGNKDYVEAPDNAKALKLAGERFPQGGRLFNGGLVGIVPARTEDEPPRLALEPLRLIGGIRHAADTEKKPPEKKTGWKGGWSAHGGADCA